MYAIVDNGGKQYKAEVGSVIKLEKLCGNVGDAVELKVVLVVDGKKVSAGKSAAGFKAVGEITEQGKDKKVVVYKYKAKKNERKKQGHRQPYTMVKITEIASAKEAK
jgi:large subunit ribosomal protein L21